MTALTKLHIAERNDIAQKLRNLSDELEDSIEAYNLVATEEWDKVRSALEAYNEAISEANQWRSDIESQIQDYISEKSEKWQGSDKGQAVDSWRSAFEEEFEEAQIEMPDDLECDCQDVAESLEQIPEGCGE